MQTGIFPQGTNYKFYLHAYSNAPKWNTSTDWTDYYDGSKPVLMDYRFPLGNLVSRIENTVPEHGRIVEDIKIEFNEFFRGLDIDGNAIKNYYEYLQPNQNVYPSYNENQSMQVKHICICYKPLLVIDYSSFFKYF